MDFKPHDCLKDIETNFYWIELGGEVDSIHDAEEVRDELIKIAYGVWDHMKNHGDHGAENWELDFIGFLPGKRESRRYVGDYILTQQDVESGKQFADEVAYGGWQIDNHLPGGFFMNGAGENHLQKKRLTEPYGIPLGCLYSKNVENLMFAGRNISASHLAFATARVMGTCGVMGQAAGTAAALAVKYGMGIRQLAAEKIGELQDILMEDDCFLPGIKRKISPLCTAETLEAEWGDASLLLNGIERKIWDCDNGYWGMCGRGITYRFGEKKHLTDFRLIVDSDLDREYTEGNPKVLNISTTLFRRVDYNHTSFGFPKCMLKAFRIEALNDEGEWETVYETDCNHQNEYYFGSELIVSPITRPADPASRMSKARTWLPHGMWVDMFHGTVYAGNRMATMWREIENIPVLIKAGGILEKHGRRLDMIISNWDELLKIMDALPSAEEIKAVLDCIEAPKTLEEIGQSAEILPMTFQASKDLRDKYVLSRLAWDLGIIDEII